MERINLDNYSIYIGEFWDDLSAFLAKESYSKIIFLVDENTKEHCLPIAEKNLTLDDFDVVEIRSGEQHKNINTCSFIWNQLLKEDIDRKALLVNLGGGVIGDMGGFCASTFKRGIDFIQLPTTLLSQVDASVGGKLGIDFGQVKNSIGLFKNPRGVFILSEFLKTLPIREVKSGFAEIIKHSLIRDVEQWHQILQIDDFKSVDWDKYIAPSVRIKHEVVLEDPFEKNIRKALNFGHTIGHAIESMALETDRPLLHGEAIGIGMICESYLSHKKLGLSYKALEALSGFILKVYGKYELSKYRYDSLYDLMKKDKKNEGNKINFTLLQDIGEVMINQNCSTDLIAESIRFYEQLS